MSEEIPYWTKLSPEQQEAVNKAWAGTDNGEACQATPREELLRQLLDSRTPKNEREHFAARHITDLQRELAAKVAELTAASVREKALLEEIEFLRNWGNKDCTSMADQALAEHRAAIADDAAKPSSP